MSKHDYHIPARAWAELRPLYHLLLAWGEYRASRARKKRVEPEDKREFELAAHQFLLWFHSIAADAGKWEMSTELRQRLRARAQRVDDLLLGTPDRERYYRQAKLFAALQVEPIARQVFQEAHSIPEILQMRIELAAQKNRPDLEVLEKILRQLPELPVPPLPRHALLPLLEHKNRDVRQAAGRMAAYLEDPGNRSCHTYPSRQR